MRAESPEGRSWFRSRQAPAAARYRYVALLLLATALPSVRLLGLVAIVVLGHVCELPAYVELASHHSAEGNADELLSSCDAVTATSSSGHAQVWTGLDMTVVLPVMDAALVSRTLQSFEDPAKLPSRLPLFLLHASLLI